MVSRTASRQRLQRLRAEGGNRHHLPRKQLRLVSASTPQCGPGGTVSTPMVYRARSCHEVRTAAVSSCTAALCLEQGTAFRWTASCQSHSAFMQAVRPPGSLFRMLGAGDRDHRPSVGVARAPTEERSWPQLFPTCIGRAMVFSTMLWTWLPRAASSRFPPLLEA